MGVVAYVSGHGFGHSAREVEILRRLPPEIPVTIKTLSPEWFWREEMGRSFTHVPDAFDVGCIQKDSIRVDVPGTWAAWQEVDERNQGRWDSEATFLEQVEAEVVVTDVAAFPLAVAARAGIPSVCVTNFTWADIYAEYVEEEPGFRGAVEAMQEQYAQATVSLDPDISLAMPYFPRRKRVGLISRPWRDRREELVARLGPEVGGKRLALVYLGNWGYPIPYPQLERFTDWQFLSLSELPVPVANWSVVGRDWFPHADLIASVDAAVAKPGYGIVGECLHAGTPLLYVPRPNFAEYAAMDATLSAWEGGFFLDTDAFLHVEWGEALSRIPARGTVTPLPAPGGEITARTIENYCQ